MSNQNDLLLMFNQKLKIVVNYSFLKVKIFQDYKMENSAILHKNGQILTICTIF